MNSQKSQKLKKTVKLEAFTQLVKKHQSGLRAFIRSIGVSSEKVDDYAQEAFLVAYKKFNEYDSDKASFGVWLKGIIRYLILNDQRKAARRCCECVWSSRQRFRRWPASVPVGR